MLCELHLPHTRLGLRTHVMHGYLSLLVTPSFGFFSNFKIKIWTPGPILLNILWFQMFPKLEEPTAFMKEPWVFGWFFLFWWRMDIYWCFHFWRMMVMRLKNHPDIGWGMVQFLMYAQDWLGPGSSFAMFIWFGHN